MRIGIEAQRIFRSKKHGMDIVALNSILALQQIDKVNEYFIFTNEQEDTNCLQETENFKIIRNPGHSYPVWEQIILPLLIKKHHIDVLHCTSNTAPLFVSVPTIITLHDIIYLENSPLKIKGTPYQKWGNFYRSKIVPMVLKKAKKVITVSEFEKNRISESIHFENNILDTIYNGVSEHFFIQSTDGQLSFAKYRYHLPDSFMFLLGNTDPKKNIARTLQAYDIYRKRVENPVPLVIADFSNETLMKELQLNDINEDIIPLIHLIGYVQNSDLPFIYQLSTAFLYPSTRESFGIPILEAMACGIPVLTSNTASMPEVAGDAALYMNPFDIFDIAKNIIEITENKETRENLIAKGLKRVENFRWFKTAEKLIEVYKSF